MKIQVLSDLHLEFHRDGGDWFLDKLPVAADVMVLAGDICPASSIERVFARFCSKYRHVIYVHGNHEFYGSDRSSVIERTMAAKRDNTNMHWLDSSYVEIDGQRFVGTPLWFRRSKAPTWPMADFTQIVDYEQWVYSENARATEYLFEVVTSSDVVITHHLPAPICVAPQFKNSPLNAFFVCDVTPIIRRRAPKVWIYGHTHCPGNFVLERTRMVCNPMGYPDENIPAFREDLVVEV